jgi:flagellar hook assembly protein FlgD
VSLEIYNLLGQRIRTLVNEIKEAGIYEIQWNGKDEAGRDMPAGMYSYKIKAGNFSEIKKMSFVK